MTRQQFVLGAVAAAFTISLTPAWAGQAGSRTNSGDTVGTAAPRGGGESSGSSSGSSSSSGSPSSSGSSGSAGSSSSGSGDLPRYVAPRAPENPQRSPSSGQRERAVPRGGGDSGSGGGAGTRSGSGSTSATSGSDGAGAAERAPVPPYSRPRDGRTPQGSAAVRRGPIPDPDHDHDGYGYYGTRGIYDPYYYGYYDPYYYGYRYGYSPYWVPGYGFGYGYFSYDPFLMGAYGMAAYGGSYGYAGYGGYGGGASTASYGSRGTGSLRLKVKPENAQVFVDGYYVGLVDGFDGVFQRLGIEAGAHKVEIKAEGYEPFQFDLMVIPGETATYKGELKRIH